jgi:hypothetical protein
MKIQCREAKLLASRLSAVCSLLVMASNNSLMSATSEDRARSGRSYASVHMRVRAIVRLILLIFVMLVIVQFASHCIALHWHAQC